MPSGVHIITPSSPSSVPRPITFPFTSTAEDGAQLYCSVTSFYKRIHLPSSIDLSNPDPKLKSLIETLSKSSSNSNSNSSNSNGNSLNIESSSPPNTFEQQQQRKLYQPPKYIYTNISYCILSTFQFQNFFSLLLHDAITFSGMYPSFSLPSYFTLHLFPLLPFPPLSSAQTVLIPSLCNQSSSSLNTNTVISLTPSLPCPPLTDLNPSQLFSYISIPNIFILFLALFSEQKIIFLSSQFSLLTLSFSYLFLLFSPFSWKFPILPILPCLPEFLSILQIPTPFCIGILKSTYNSNILHNPSLELNDIFLFDLDNNSILQMPFPQPLFPIEFYENCTLNLKKVLNPELWFPDLYKFESKASSKPAAATSLEESKDIGVMKEMKSFWRSICVNWQKWVSWKRVIPEPTLDFEPELYLKLNKNKPKIVEEEGKWYEMMSKSGVFMDLIIGLARGEVLEEEEFENSMEIKTSKKWICKIDKFKFSETLQQKQLRESESNKKEETKETKQLEEGGEEEEEDVNLKYLKEKMKIIIEGKRELNENKNSNKELKNEEEALLLSKTEMKAISYLLKQFNNRLSLLSILLNNNQQHSKEENIHLGIESFGLLKSVFYYCMKHSLSQRDQYCIKLLIFSSFLYYTSDPSPLSPLSPHSSSSSSSHSSSSSSSYSSSPSNKELKELNKENELSVNFEEQKYMYPIWKNNPILKQQYFDRPEFWQELFHLVLSNSIEKLYNFMPSTAITDFKSKSNANQAKEREEMEEEEEDCVLQAMTDILSKMSLLNVPITVMVSVMNKLPNSCNLSDKRKDILKKLVLCEVQGKEMNDELSFNNELIKLNSEDSDSSSLLSPKGENSKPEKVEKQEKNTKKKRKKERSLSIGNKDREGGRGIGATGGVFRSHADLGVTAEMGKIKRERHLHRKKSFGIFKSVHTKILARKQADEKELDKDKDKDKDKDNNQKDLKTFNSNSSKDNSPRSTTNCGSLTNNRELWVEGDNEEEQQQHVKDEERGSKSELIRRKK